MPDRTINALLEAWRSLERELESAEDETERRSLQADIELLREIQSRAAERRTRRAGELGTDPREP